MSQVSTTDMKVFFGLANPANTRTPNTEDEDDSEAESGRPPEAATGLHHDADGGPGAGRGRQ